MEDQSRIVTLLDETGAEVEFDHLLTFKHLEVTYIALLPIDASDTLKDDEVLLLQVVNEGDDEKYIPIENEVLLEEVFEVFLELFEEEIDGEDE